MSLMYIQVAVGLSCLTFVAYCGLEVIPERMKLVHLNDKYFYNFSVNVKRYSRSSPYYMNIEITTKQTWTNNVTLHFTFNEFLHNDYRRSFVELHQRFCDMVKYDKFIGPVMKHVGFECPMPPRTVRMTNFTLPLDKFPNVLPFEKCRFDAEATLTETNESLALAYNYVTFKVTHHTYNQEQHVVISSTSTRKGVGSVRLRIQSLPLQILGFRPSCTHCEPAGSEDGIAGRVLLSALEYLKLKELCWLRNKKGVDKSQLNEIYISP
ncbi:unnamed protein product [Danaus chrysippus]|uniref:(African queen) hypothetical protein n=1 Tax=Danaus chrysippus TaxID=151541 RepID=A0A8J2WBN9_9NEOP|nr:unnamed protein product [Danaus chrysippus]